MESLLIVVTVASLLIALAMSIVAWSLIRAERQRAAARLEALEALAFEPSLEDGQAGVRPAVDVPHWDGALGSQPGTFRPQQMGEQKQAPPSITFAATTGATGSGGPWLAVAAIALLVAATYATVAALKSPEIAGALAATSAEAGRRGVPIELLSLRHTLAVDGSFTVAGLVQNPQNGRQHTGLEAVVYLFDDRDQYFTTAKAPLDTTAMLPGSESSFEVRVPNAARVSRYRVGFREAGGATVAHLDRRRQVLKGTTDHVISHADLVPPSAGMPAASEDNGR